jgi:hypothetical protein
VDDEEDDDYDDVECDGMFQLGHDGMIVSYVLRLQTHVVILKKLPGELQMVWKTLYCPTFLILKCYE